MTFTGSTGQYLGFRCDASPQAGTGHVMRCIGLAQAWQERGGRAFFILTEENPGIRSRLETEEIEYRVLSAASASTDEAECIAAVLREAGANWLVLDGYQYDGDYQRTLRERGILLVVVTDYAHAAHFSADIVVNPLANAIPADYAIAANALLLFGPKYIFLRREFRAAKDQPGAGLRDVKRVLVSFGGADPVDMTSRAVRTLATHPWEGVEFIVIVGMNSPFRQNVEQEVARAGRAFTVIYNTADMAGLMGSCTLGVCSASATCWEAAHLGLPVVTVSIADNQVAVAGSIEAIGSGINLGWHDKVAGPALVAAVASLMEDPARRRIMAAAGRGQVDGNGVYRVIDAMGHKAAGPSFSPC